MTTMAPRPQFSIGDLFSQAWSLFSANIGIVLGGYLLIFLILSVGSYLIVGFLLAGPLLLGYSGTLLKMVRGEPTEFSDIFSGFQQFLPALVASLLVGIFSTIGFILCILPGLFVVLIYMLVFFYMYDKKLDFWPSMEASRTTVMADLGTWILLFLALAGLNILGAIACGIGTLITTPLGMLMLAAAYNSLEGPSYAEEAPLPEEPSTY